MKTVYRTQCKITYQKGIIERYPKEKKECALSLTNFCFTIRTTVHVRIKQIKKT